jgi:hypothetical protein
MRVFAPGIAESECVVGVGSPFARERGTVRDNFYPIEAFTLNPSPYPLPFSEGEGTET